ncbi:choline BCCT transporter BetT [Salinisphaera sp. Q1T1-3]|uniref:choline BCCT transporter BetT n=1 Tax=Salinisphaera sp. Q1T1-3 TaxID=2321229 RepID=UPI000E7185AD|nr:choline BCCT transporter BetT [Salinisphaera sp. Q1T1-3]RJS95104.1 BCCT family transporter [Salinisphaera sp. Q1T1-3]
MSQTSSDNTPPSEDRLNPIVFYGSAITIVLFSLWTIIFTSEAQAVINAVQGWISATFGWYYFLTVLLYLVFVIAVALSRFGRIRLGPEQSRPEFNLFSWSAMLFSAGIGIGVIFYGIAEPILQYNNAPDRPADDIMAARHAMELTFLHWGISGWAIYSLVGMSLAFFSYRYDLPLTIRSALYPLFGNRIHGWIGHTVDVAAVVATVFGIAAALGIGIVQLNFGMNYMFGITANIWTQIFLVVMIVGFATISAVTGVEKGIRRLSEFNILLAIALLAFVLFTGNTLFLLNTFVTNVGDYVKNFVGLSTDTFSFGDSQGWLDSWTLFFWAWWIAWGPFVGLFLARISRGRTIAEFVAGTMTLPILFMMIWMSLLGNSALDLAMNGGTDFGQQVMDNPPSGIYLFLAQMPFPLITTIAVTVLGIVFFVTSGDSGALVLSNFTSYLKNVNSDAPVWMRILWAVIIGVLTLALLLAGSGTSGLATLQSAVVITGLPFSVVLFFMMAGLWKALQMEAFKFDSQRVSLPGHLSSRTGGRDAVSWTRRVARAMSFPSYRSVMRYLDSAVRPAMDDVATELREQGMEVEVFTQGEGDERHAGLRVALGEEPDFNYQVWPRRFQTPTFAMRASKANSDYYRLEVFLTEGTQGYDLMDYSKAQVIDDILDQYESHLHFLHLNRVAPGESSLPDGPEQPSN